MNEITHNLKNLKIKDKNKTKNNDEYIKPEAIEISPHNLFIDIIKEQVKKEAKNDIWQNSSYSQLPKLQSNNVGITGEVLLHRICKNTDILANCNGLVTKKIGGGEGDGHILGKTVEIKTAVQGSSSESFQHELAEHPWRAEFIIFVDVSHNCIYLTIFENFSEEIYKSRKKLPKYFPTKTITWRKGSGAFKLDTTISINEKSIINGNAIKITETTHSDDIAKFIKKIII